MISKLLYKLTANRPCKLIELDSGPYLERYYLGQLFGITFYLHRFVSSDSERHLHNHPWRWGRSIILSGSYTEERAVDLCPYASNSGCITEHHRIFWWNRVNGNTFHQIHDAQWNTWTLFFHSERIMINRGMAKVPKGWGFLVRMDQFSVFQSYSSTYIEWWLKAPKGKDSRRLADEAHR